MSPNRKSVSKKLVKQDLREAPGEISLDFRALEKGFGLRLKKADRTDLQDFAELFIADCYRCSNRKNATRERRLCLRIANATSKRPFTASRTRSLAVLLEEAHTVGRMGTLYLPFGTVERSLKLLRAGAIPDEKMLKELYASAVSWAGPFRDRGAPSYSSFLNFVSSVYFVYTLACQASGREPAHFTWNPVTGAYSGQAVEFIKQVVLQVKPPEKCVPLNRRRAIAIGIATFLRNGFPLPGNPPSPPEERERLFREALNDFNREE